MSVAVALVAGNGKWSMLTNLVMCFCSISEDAVRHEMGHIRVLWGVAVHGNLVYILSGT